MEHEKSSKSKRKLVGTWSLAPGESKEEFKARIHQELMQGRASSGGDRADIVSLADWLAARYHEGQPDKAGEPYIGHPRRVAARLSDPTLRAAALLHDVLEDTKATSEGLAAEGVPPEVIRIVEILTRSHEEGYEAFVARVAKDPRARMVKIADVLDNTDPRRPFTAEQSAEMQQRYHAALEVLFRAFIESSPDE